MLAVSGLLISSKFTFLNPIPTLVPSHASCLGLNLQLGQDFLKSFHRCCPTKPPF